MRKRPVLIVGTKILACMVSDLCGRLSVPVRGYIDDSRSLKTWDGKPIVGTIAEILKGKKVWKKFGIIIAIGDNQNRKRISEQFIQEGFSLPSLIDPSCVVAKNAVIEDGTLLFAFSYAGTHVVIGKGTIVLPSVTLTHDDEVGAYSFFSSGAVVAGRVKIEPMAKIQLGTVIAPDTTVCADE